MSDLVKRLRCEAHGAEFSNRYAELVGEAADRIEQLERELKAAASAEPMTATEILLGREIDKLEQDLAAEKALADELLRLVNDDGGDREAVRAAYRKARGL